MSTNVNPQSVACTLTLPDGRVISFEMPGPLVAMAPAPEKAEKKVRRARR